MTTTPPLTPTALPAFIADVSASSITRSGSTVTWTTTAPASSQVEYGTTAVDTFRTAPDASLVLAHRVVLTGLLPGATYRFRVRSVTASGALTVSPETVLVTAPPGSGPELSSVVVNQVTGTTATVSWATATGDVAQVEYGTTANYGSFTLLKVFATPTQTMTLTGLAPATTYHFRVKGWDGTGALGDSPDATFTTAPSGVAMLLGDTTLQPERVTLAGGQAVAYQYVARQSGQASLVGLYVEAANSPVVRVALYSDQEGAPGVILAQGSAPSLVPGWISISIPAMPLLQGDRYWLTVLNPLGGGTLGLRQAADGGSSVTSAQTSLAAFPSTWTAGTPAAKSPLSAYVQQVPPAITLTGPTDGSIVGGQVQLTAVIDDDVPLARVQFFVDGVPVGQTLTTAPYAVSWDSVGFNARMPHMITARASDALGRSSTSGTVTVQVDNGPLISGVAVSAGLSTSSMRISWATNTLADAQVEFGPTSAYGQSTPVDTRTDLHHEMQLTGLLPGMVYHYRVRSRDANGALGVSGDQVFFTPQL